MKSIKSFNLIALAFMLSLLMFSCTQNPKANNAKNNLTDSNSKNQVEKRKRTIQEKDNIAKKQKAKSGAKILTRADAKKAGKTKAFSKINGKNEALNQKGTKRLTLDNNGKVSFVGKKLIGKHSGFFPIKSGNLIIDRKGVLIGGNFEFSMSELQIVDLKGKSKKQLENHLKSKDFFDVKKNATASFEIINITKMDEGGKVINVEGNLTMNGITKSILFPAEYKNFNGAYKASAKFSIDRTQWGIHYGNDRSLKDKFIKPEVDIIVVVSSK